MPYIEPKARDELTRHRRHPATPGELNYIFTMAAIEYVERVGLSYHAINDVLGALEGAKLEFYRRVAVRYENDKVMENGDVYPHRS